MTTFTFERRHTLIRTVVAVTGDLGAATAIASACSWIVSYAALGMFANFVLWLIAALLALAVSQHLVHPAVEFALSDRKLDHALDAVTGVVDALTVTATAVGGGAWSALRRSIARA